jgi:hypothetical protein
VQVAPSVEVGIVADEPGPALPNASDRDGNDPVDDYIANLVSKTFGGELAMTDTAAPVVLPDKEELTVRLVTQHSLNRLQDAESDRALFDSATWCIIGAGLGFATNVITGAQPVTAAGWVFVAMLAVALIGLIAIRTRVGRRLRDARKRVK